MWQASFILRLLGDEYAKSDFKVLTYNTVSVKQRVEEVFSMDNTFYSIYVILLNVVNTSNPLTMGSVCDEFDIMLQMVRLAPNVQFVAEQNRTNFISNVYIAHSFQH